VIVDSSALIAIVLREPGWEALVDKLRTRDELRGLTGAPVLLANLLVTRVIAEACSG